MIIYLQNDDRIVGQTIQAFLSRLGYHVIPFQDGPSLWELLKDYMGCNAVVIVGLNLFRQTDTSLLRALHQQYPELSVVLLTEAGSVLPTMEALACGVYGFLHQPLHLTELELMLYRIGRTQIPSADEPNLCYTMKPTVENNSTKETTGGGQQDRGKARGTNPVLSPDSLCIDREVCSLVRK